MALTCPLCSNYSFSYWEKMRLHSRSQKKRVLRCNSCRENVSPTTMSLMLYFYVSFASIMFLVGIDAGTVKGMFLVLINQIFVIWPFFIIRVEDASVGYDYVPESRLIGYSVYLGLPILLTLFAFVLAEIVNMF